MFLHERKSKVSEELSDSRALVDIRFDMIVRFLVCISYATLSTLQTSHTAVMSVYVRH